MYQLRCLGEASLRDATGQLVHFRSRKHFALLAYLALNEDRAHRRERLAGLLWSESDDSRARHSLSQALYAVRRVLEDTVRIEGEDLELRSTNLRVDAVELQRLLESGEPAAAADLYRGDFLEGFWVRGAQGFEDWAGRERARVAGLARDALRRAIKTARERCEWSAVQHYAERLVQLDPFDEAGQAELMRALWMLGDRTAALERYEELKRVLAAELQAVPSRETQELAARIRERAVRGGWAGLQLREQTPPFDEPPFVGRKRELSTLAGEWDRVVAGVTRHVSLAGAGGIGKTRLAHEFFNSLALDDVTVMSGACYEAESALPYGPVAEALRRQLDQLELRDVNPIWLAELARIVPEVGSRCGSLPQPTELDAEGGRRRLYEGIAQVLRSECEVRPLLLFIDDLHWADDSSLSLLHYIRRRVSNGLFLLTSHRPEELARRGSASVQKLMSEKSAPLRTIDLHGLDESESSDLLMALLGVDSSSGAVRSLRKKSGGNPFFAIELARNFAQLDERSGRSPVPESIKSLLDRRFDGLGELARTVLRQAAFLGSRSSYAALTAATGLPPLEFAAVIQELVGAGILYESEGLLRFRHDLIREVAVQQIPAALTGALHRRSARALMRADGEPGEIARHLAAAGEVRSAHVYALRGATAAERIYALQEAADLLQLAITHAPSESARIDLVGRLGKLYLHMREYERARPLLVERLRWVEERGKSVLDSLEARRDLLLVDTYSSALTVEESAQAMERLYEDLSASGIAAPRLAAEVLRSIFWAAARSFNPGLVKETIAKIRDLHERTDDPEVLCRTARSLGIYECYRGRLDEAECLLYRALDWAREAEDEVAVVEAYVGLTALLHRSIRQELAERILSVAVPLAVMHADPANAGALMSNCAVCHMYLRNLSVAEELLQKTVKMLQSAGDFPEMSPSLDYNLGYVARLKGDLTLAETAWNRALAKSRTQGVVTVAVESLAALGELALSRGEMRKARDSAAQALRLARRAQHLLDQRFGLHNLIARLEYTAGKKVRALSRLAILAETALTSDLPFYLAAQLTRLELLELEGREVEVETVAKELSAVARTLGAVWWVEKAEQYVN